MGPGRLREGQATEQARRGRLMRLANASRKLVGRPIPGLPQLLPRGRKATKTLYHAALDFGGFLGDPVRAAADGVVAKIIPDDGVHDHGFGNTVILRNMLSNGDPIYSLYAHLDSFGARTVAGACISEGTELGKMGGSGLGDEHHWPEHVHFELKLESGLRNPLGPGPCGGICRGRPRTTATSTRPTTSTR